MAKTGISPNFYKPFHVRQIDRRFMEGFDTMEAAEADVVVRNDRAKKLGIKARYEAVENPGEEG